MADPSDAPVKTDSAGVSAEELQALAETVHTYESFGRAIVASALAEAAKRGPDAGSLSASVSVRPVRRRDRPDDTAGGFAKGHYEDPHCVVVDYVWVEGGPVHHLTICRPW